MRGSARSSGGRGWSHTESWPGPGASATTPRGRRSARPSAGSSPSGRLPDGRHRDRRRATTRAATTASDGGTDGGDPLVQQVAVLVADGALGAGDRLLLGVGGQVGGLHALRELVEGAGQVRAAGLDGGLERGRVAGEGVGRRPGGAGGGVRGGGSGGAAHVLTVTTWRRRCALAARRRPGRSRRAARAGAGRAGPGPAGRRSSAPSWAMRPESRTTLRSHSSSANGRSWVTTTTVTGSPDSTSSSSRRLAGSRLLDGSSSTRTSQRIASTVATATRRRWPNDRWCGGRSASLAHADGVERLVDPGVQVRPAQAEVGRPERHVVADRRHEELVVGVLEHEPDPAADLAEGGLGHRDPADEHLAHGVGAGGLAEDAVEVQEQRGLAGPVGPEHREALAAGHGQVHAEQRLVPVRVGEGDLAQLERRGAVGRLGGHGAHPATTSQAVERRRPRARPPRRRPPGPTRRPGRPTAPAARRAPRAAAWCR